jgi:hypothetical protein
LDWIDELSNDLAFATTVALSDKAKEERYDMELVVRGVTLRAIAEEQLKYIEDVDTFLTDHIIELARAKPDLQGRRTAFQEDLLPP